MKNEWKKCNLHKSRRNDQLRGAGRFWQCDKQINGCICGCIDRYWELS